MNIAIIEIRLWMLFDLPQFLCCTVYQFALSLVWLMKDRYGFNRVFCAWRFTTPMWNCLKNIFEYVKRKIYFNAYYRRFMCFLPGRTLLIPAIALAITTFEQKIKYKRNKRDVYTLTWPWLLFAYVIWTHFL